MERMSQDATKVLYALYSQYQSRRKVGQSKYNARRFGSSESIQSDLCSSMSPNDVCDSLRELWNLEYLVCDPGSNTIVACFLTDKALTDFEYLTKDRILSFVDFCSKLK